LTRSDNCIDVLIAIPVLLVGGTEWHTLALAKALQSTGMRVRVCCYFEYAPAMLRAFEEGAIAVTLLRLERASGFWHFFRSLRAVFKSLNPGVVHVQYIAPGLIPVLAARATGIRTVFATVHQPGDRFGTWEHLLFSIAARLCTVFFCVSQAVELSWFGNSAVFSADALPSGRRHFTIYNGVDADLTDKRARHAKAEELRAKLGLTGRKVIGIVGRLRVEKGHVELLNALPLVLKAIPDATLLVVGDGPDRAALADQARSLGVLPHIVWTGEKSPEETLALYAAMDVVAVPSRFEGFGLSAAEAMAAGRPVVATRVGGLPEVVEHGLTGYLVAPNDSQALAEALIAVLDDPGAAANLGACGRIRVSEHFSSKRFSASFVEAFRCFGRSGAFTGSAVGRLPPDFK
jgi:glycosyltransferase involved in cell wall biosynthesis